MLSYKIQHQHEIEIEHHAPPLSPNLINLINNSKLILIEIMLLLFRLFKYAMYVQSLQSDILDMICRNQNLVSMMG